MTNILATITIGFCWWDLPALLVLLAAAAYCCINYHNLKEDEKELGDQLSSLYADKTMTAE